LNWHFTVGRILPMLFSAHPAFAREMKLLHKKLDVGTGMASIKKLLAVHFDSENPKPAIAPGKLHRIKVFDMWSLWKVEVMVIGLRPSQWPRVWFLLRGAKITFLVGASHMQNYNDSEMEMLALDRLSDYVG
jgi:hypothetical protein